LSKCPACGFENKAADFLAFYTSRGYDKSWLRCGECRAYFMGSGFDERTEEENTLTNSSRNEQLGTYINKYKQKMFNFILGEVKKEAPQAKTILDIGSSYGGFLFNAREQGYSVTGTEIAPPAVEYMKSNGIEAYLLFSVKEMPEAKRFDVITALDCNMYWPDQRSELLEIKKRLSPGGIFIMRVVDKSWAVTIGRALRKVVPSAGNKLIRRSLNDHRFSMPVSSLKNLLKETGYKIICTSVSGAIHSSESGADVKFSFFVGNLIYKLTRIFLAPGMVLVMKKN
jgi:SAM-dependent methyltransferase